MAHRPARRRRRSTLVALGVLLLVAGAFGVAAPARHASPWMRSLGDAPATVWAVGDGADGSPAARALARRIAAGPVARLLYLGDVYETGSAAEFAAHYAPVYGRLAGRTAPTPGNHEWPRRAEGYDPYWTRVRGRRPPPWYAFRVAGWEVLSLNSQAPHDLRSAQLRWLRRAVRAPGTCRIALWHRPRYSAGVHGDQADVAPLWNALRGRAALVLSGHDHDLQRLRPRDGLVQYVVGAGGHSHYPVRPDRRLAWADDTRDGALRLDLRPGTARARVVATDGRVLDESRLRCRPGG